MTGLSDQNNYKTVYISCPNTLREFLYKQVNKNITG